jgi:hypothetical protein
MAVEQSSPWLGPVIGGLFGVLITLINIAAAHITNKHKMPPPTPPAPTKPRNKKRKK